MECPQTLSPVYRICFLLFNAGSKHSFAINGCLHGDREAVSLLVISQIQAMQSVEADMSATNIRGLGRVVHKAMAVLRHLA